MNPSNNDRFTRLVHEHVPALGNYLRRRLYPLTLSDLDDVVEETLVIVWQRIDDVPAEAELAWIIGVGRNVLRNAQRKKYRRSALEMKLSPRSDDVSAESHVIADQSVRAALAALNDDDREILLLHAWDGFDAHSIARVFSISPNAAAVRLSRVQRRFRTLLEGSESE